MTRVHTIRRLTCDETVNLNTEPAVTYALGSFYVAWSRCILEKRYVYKIHGMHMHTQGSIKVSVPCPVPFFY